MAKYGAANLSQASVDSAPPTHAQVDRDTDQANRQDYTKEKTPRPAHRIEKDKLDNARARFNVSVKHAQLAKKLRETCSVYVGNLGPGVDEKTLIAHFRSCGDIKSASIHCCGGVAMSSRPAHVSQLMALNVSQFAVVTFGSRATRLRACKMDGTILAGRELIVSIAVSDLPELQDKIRKRLDDYRRRLEPADVHRARISALRSLKTESTALLDARYEEGRRTRKLFRFMDVTFGEGIM